MRHQQVTVRGKTSFFFKVYQNCVLYFFQNLNIQRDIKGKQNFLLFKFISNLNSKIHLKLL